MKFSYFLTTVTDFSDRHYCYAQTVLIILKYLFKTKGQIYYMDYILIIRQFKHESDTWKRNLEFLMQENTHLKNRLSEVLNTTSADDELLTAAEEYQNRFVREDESFHLLRRDIAELDNILTREIFEDGMLKKELTYKQKKLSKEIETAIKEFNKLKFEFNNYLGEAL